MGIRVKNIIYQIVNQEKDVCKFKFNNFNAMINSSAFFEFVPSFKIVDTNVERKIVQLPDIFGNIGLLSNYCTVHPKYNGCTSFT
jgi:hypothetical protein